MPADRPADAPGTRRLVVAVGAAAPGTADAVLALAPHHPAAHGLLRLVLTVDAEDVVLTADPQVGYMHRGAEKLFEARDYRQILMLADRHDWLSAFAGELGVCLVVETMLGLDVPARAVWLRTLLAELTRVAHHLAFLGAVPGGTPASQARAAAMREEVQVLLEEHTGGRMHVMANRLGGLLEDVPAGWPGHVRATVARLRADLPALVEGAVHPDDGRGVAVLDRATALSYGVSGPALRAAGEPMDLRLDAPYLAYAALPVRSVTRAEGDATARLQVLAEQTAHSLDLVDACLDDLPTGPIDVKLPKNVKAPEGSAYAWTEAPLGATGWYLVSSGERTPYRLKLRTPSFATVSALPAVLPGTRLADLALAVASLPYVTGDLDR